MPDHAIRIGTGLIELGPDATIATKLYNGQFPGPLLRLTEGKRVVIDIHNDTECEVLQASKPQSTMGSSHGSDTAGARGQQNPVDLALRLDDAPRRPQLHKANISKHRLRRQRLTSRDIRR